MQEPQLVPSTRRTLKKRAWISTQTPSEENARLYVHFSKPCSDQPQHCAAFEQESTPQTDTTNKKRISAKKKLYGLRKVLSTIECLNVAEKILVICVLSQRNGDQLLRRTAPATNPRETLQALVSAG